MKYLHFFLVTFLLCSSFFVFLSDNPVNMDLDQVYILTGNGSASASELTITGLDAYMDVVLIGDTTYGKYTGSITLKPEDMYTDSNYYKDFDNWGLHPVAANMNSLKLNHMDLSL